MNKTFLRKQLFSITLFILLIGGAHFALLFKVLPNVFLATKPWTIYAFLYPITLIGFLMIYNRFIKDDTSVVKSYMFFITVKILAVLFFLSPWLFPKSDLTKPFLYQFFILFFIFLFLEIRILLQMLNDSSSKIEKN